MDVHVCVWHPLVTRDLRPKSYTSAVEAPASVMTVQAYTGMTISIAKNPYENAFPRFCRVAFSPPPITILPGSKSPFLLFSLQCKSRFQPERSLETSSPFSMSFSSLLVSFTNRRTYGILPCFAVAVRGRWSFMKEPRLPMQNVFHLYATDVI